MKLTGIFLGKNSAPLAGVRILDLSRILAGPFCTMLLGDLGAEVIKVEDPRGPGDDTRRWGPPFIRKGDQKESCYFLSVNRNKKSVCVDFKHKDGNNIIKRLVEKSDVLVENYLPGKLSEMGLNYESLKEINPGLIYCSITGFGSKGPYAGRAGYDVIAASIGGLLHVTGPRGGPPCKVGVALTDICTGLYAHGAIMAALISRGVTGRGQRVECDLLSTQVSTMVNLASSYLNGGGLDQGRQGTAHASIVPYQAFETADGKWITIGCGNEKQFGEFCAAIQKSDLIREEKFGTNANRVKNREELLDIIGKAMKGKSSDEWQNIFSGYGFPFGPINDLAAVFSDPQVKFNGTVQQIEHDLVGVINQVSPAVKYSDSANEIKLPPPSVGQHTHQVLSELLRISDEDIRRLKKDKVVL